MRLASKKPCWVLEPEGVVGKQRAEPALGRIGIGPFPFWALEGGGPLGAWGRQQGGLSLQYPFKRSWGSLGTPNLLQAWGQGSSSWFPCCFQAAPETHSSLRKNTFGIKWTWVQISA